MMGYTTPPPSPPPSYLSYPKVRAETSEKAFTQVPLVHAVSVMIVCCLVCCLWFYGIYRGVGGGGLAQGLGGWLC